MTTPQVIIEIMYLRAYRAMKGIEYENMLRVFDDALFSNALFAWLGAR